jgi:hypothetical protein
LQIAQISFIDAFISAAVAALPDVNAADGAPASSSSSSSSLASFKSALDAATRFSHLSALVKEAEDTLDQKKEESVSLVRRHVVGGTMQEMTKSIEIATRLGVDAPFLTSSLNAARQRDADAMKSVKEAAAAEPFVASK